MTQPEPDLHALLARLRSEPLQPSSAVEEDLREERLSQHIDQHLAALEARRRLKVRRLRVGAALLMAAGLTFASVPVWAPRSNPQPVAIDREPLLRHARALTPATESRPPTPKAEEASPTPPVPPSVRPHASAHSSDPAHPSPDTGGELAPPAAPTASALVGPSLSTLSEENQLFQTAAQAERAGDSETALARLSQLLRKFPLSPIAQNAMARKFRLLARGGRNAEATQAAAEYLRAFPQGFAEREARGLVTAEGAQPDSSK